jgi:hypothetical protein
VTHEDYSVLACDVTEFGGDYSTLKMELTKFPRLPGTNLQNCALSHLRGLIFTFTAVKHKYLTTGGHTST